MIKATTAASSPSTSTATTTLQRALELLAAHQPELNQLGLLHAAIFGSVARGDDDPGSSDIDVLVELDPAQPLGVFEYSRLKLEVEEILSTVGHADVVNRQTLKPLLRDSILRDAVHAF